MKVLYAIQGTGNGHISRARDVVPILSELVHTDVLISGTQADVTLPWEVKYRYKGLSFIFGKNGGVDLWKTFLEAKSSDILKEIDSLPVDDYNLIINDFEPVSSWACKRKNKTCVGLSHQAAAAHENSPKPKVFQPAGKFLLHKYAPVTHTYGFHFKRYAPNIYTPVIRQEVRKAENYDGGHYTVYLPAFSDEKLVDFLLNFSDIKWQVFSKHNKKAFTNKQIEVMPISNEAFIKSMATSTGVLCGAGFEAPAEALFLKKKVLAIPMSNQYEQQCNAASLTDIGVPVISTLSLKYKKTIRNWLDSNEIVQVDYPDVTKSVLEEVLRAHKII